MAKQKKAPRPKAETPKGFRDYFGVEVTERADMLRTIAGVYHRYGFDPLESSAVETVEALGKFLPDVDRPNEGVFAWQDDDETWLALRGLRTLGVRLERSQGSATVLAHRLAEHRLRMVEQRQGEPRLGARQRRRREHGRLLGWQLRGGARSHLLVPGDLRRG